jgi:hypothetical protein
VAPADQKAVAAIESLIGQSIAWAGEPVGAEAASAPRREHAPRGHQGRRPGKRPPQVERAPRPERTAANVAPIETARPRPAQRPRPEHPQGESSDAAQLPAFLLRPIRAKV